MCHTAQSIVWNEVNFALLSEDMLPKQSLQDQQSQPPQTSLENDPRNDCHFRASTSLIATGIPAFVLTSAISRKRIPIESIREAIQTEKKQQLTLSIQYSTLLSKLSDPLVFDLKFPLHYLNGDFFLYHRLVVFCFEVLFLLLVGSAFGSEAVDFLFEF
jgi:hypothetical protein